MVVGGWFGFGVGGLVCVTVGGFVADCGFEVIWCGGFRQVTCVLGVADC